MSRYFFHFSISGFNVLTLDMMFNNLNTYGAVDYIVIYEHDITRGYLSEQGMKECYAISAQLLDDAFFDTVISESENLCREFEKYETPQLNRENVILDWKKRLVMNNEFGRLYRLYEQPFQQALESIVLQSISKEELTEILSKKTVDAVTDMQVKKYVNRLIAMGTMKLRLHLSSEKFFTDTVFTEYAATLNTLSDTLAGAMRKNEFESALIGTMTFSAETLEERLKGCVFVKENEIWNVYIGKRFSDWKNRLSASYGENIQGNTAFLGLVTGKVKIHLSWTEITELDDGDILVTGMTNPQMIPMIKKAGAIVTDEGGITCHAAVISRELKKPCIVGTKNATQILQDGDLVEVDANNGILRILERARE